MSGYDLFFELFSIFKGSFLNFITEKERCVRINQKLFWLLLAHVFWKLMQCDFYQLTLPSIACKKWTSSRFLGCLEQIFFWVKGHFKVRGVWKQEGGWFVPLNFYFWLCVDFGCHACLGRTHQSCDARSTLLIEISSLHSFSGILENVWVSNLRLQAIWIVWVSRKKSRAGSLLMLVLAYLFLIWVWQGQLCNKPVPFCNNLLSKLSLCAKFSGFGRKK